jgi:hypothetical protein
MDLVNVASMVGGLGLGTLIQSVVTHALNIKSKTTEQLYAEKRETYLGLLSALHQAAVNPSDENAKAYALWQTRCTLFGSEKVIRFAQEIVNTNGEGQREERNVAYEGLLQAMREDLEST